MTNRPFGPINTGVTNDISRRARGHRNGKGSAFTARYHLFRLVYAERHEEISTAIQREKTIKHWPRMWKMNLIESQNPLWEDLFKQLNG